MPRRWKPILVIGTCLILAAAAYWLASAGPAQAQCGSQASSCKNCHEVQGQDPVNAKGDWHISHAFGDFCQFCHAGNVQATDKAAAHAGMVQPLGDIQANCASCHPSDAAEKAEVYAAALGVTIGAGGANPTQPPSTPQPTTAAPAIVTQAPAEAAGGGLIDYNAQYAETVEGKVPVNWGNVILGMMVAMLAVGGGAFVIWNERRLRRGGLHAQGAAVAAAGAAAPLHPESLPPDVLALLPKLQALNPLGRHALERLLADPQAASELLYRLSKLDPALVEQVRGLDRESRSLLLAVSGS